LVLTIKDLFSNFKIIKFQEEIRRLSFTGGVELAPAEPEAPKIEPVLEPTIKVPQIRIEQVEAVDQVKSKFILIFSGLFLSLTPLIIKHIVTFFNQY